MRQYNRFLLFLCNCIPGCGQFYLGYMKRGLSLLLLAACIVSTWSSYVFDLSLFGIVVWLYAFFDGYNLYRALMDGTAKPDDYLFHLPQNSIFSQRRRVLGWGLAAVGVSLCYFSIANGILEALGYSYWDDDFFYHLLLSYIPRGVISLLLIFLGIRFIRGPKQEKKPPLENDFVPPQSAPADDGSSPDSTEQSPQ